MKTFQEMIGSDCGRNIDRQINAIVGEFHRNVEQLCKEEFDRFALSNGYVRASDLDAMKAKLAEVTDQLKDATDTLDQIEAESACFDALARSAGYVKLEPGHVVVDEAKYSLALHMAAKWADHVTGRDRGVTFTRISNLEARDE